MYVKRNKYHGRKKEINLEEFDPEESERLLESFDELKREEKKLRAIRKLKKDILEN